MDETKAAFWRRLAALIFWKTFALTLGIGCFAGSAFGGFFYL